MPAFNYDYYKSPHTGTIADLMRGPSRAAAQSALIGGQASAQRAQAWGGLAAGVSNTIGDLVQYQQTAKTAKVKAAADAQQRDLNALTIAGKQGDLYDADLKREQERTAAAQKSAAADAIAQIKGGNAEAVLSKLPPEVRRIAEEGLAVMADNKNKRSKLQLEVETATRKDLAERARLVQKFAYDPVISEVIFGLSEEDYPQAAEIWQQIGGDPAKLKAQIDAWATADQEPRVPTIPADYTLGDSRRSGTTHQVLATAAAEPKDPGTREVVTVDAQGNRVIRIVADVPGQEFRAPAPAGGGPDDPPSQAQRGAAERWKQTQLLALETRYRASLDARQPMSTDVLNAEKARIQASYLEQINWHGEAVPQPARQVAPGGADRGTPPAAVAAPAHHAPVHHEGPAVKPAATPNTGVRGEATAVLAQFLAEQDPTKKKALADRLRGLRDQLTGAR